MFGNPHSGKPGLAASTELADRARRHVLRHFHASPDEYAVVFTANASGALRLVGEAYPFDAGGHYLLTADNHNSVNGIREFARARGAAVSYVPLTPPDLRVDDVRCSTGTSTGRLAGAGTCSRIPAQSNFSGVQHPLDWIERAQARGWDVLLDAAAFVPTQPPRPRPAQAGLRRPLVLQDVRLPDRRRLPDRAPGRAGPAAPPWFAGGTIAVASVLADRHSLAEGEAGFEDGTINYLGLPAVEIGLRHLESIGIETIHERVRCLAGWLLDRLPALRHGNGQPLVRLYGPATTEARGGTVTFNFLDAEGASRPPRDRGPRRGGEDLAAHRLLLQPRRAPRRPSGSPPTRSPPAGGRTPAGARSPTTTWRGASTASPRARCG